MPLVDTDAERTYPEAVGTAATEGQPPCEPVALDVRRLLSDGSTRLVPGTRRCRRRLRRSGSATGGTSRRRGGRRRSCFLAWQRLCSSFARAEPSTLRALVDARILLALLFVWVLASSAWGSPSEAVPEAQRALLYVVRCAGPRARSPPRSDRGSPDRRVGRDLRRLRVRACDATLSRAVRRLSIGLRSTGSPSRSGTGMRSGCSQHSARSWHSGSLRTTSDFSSGSPRQPRPSRSRSRCYFTFSRGAWIALAIGLVAVLVLDPRRLRLALVVAFVAPGPPLLCSSRRRPAR